MLVKLKRITQIAGLFLAVLMTLSACVQAANMDPPTNSPAAPLSPTFTPRVTPSPTSTPEPDPQIISPANADQVVLLGYLNKGGAIGAPIYSPDGKWLFQASTTGIYRYDTATYSQVTLLAYLPRPETYSSGYMSLSPDGKVLQLQSGELVSVDGGHKSFDLEPPPNVIVKHIGERVFSPDGSMEAVRYNNDFVSVWRLTDGKLLHTFKGKSMEFSADSRSILVQVFIADQSGELQHCGYLYDVETGKKLDEWPGESFVFLPDNRLVVESDGYVRIFDVETHKAYFSVEGSFATFSPDQQMLAVASSGQIKLYRVSDGALLRKLQRSMRQFDSAALKFSANGEIITGITSQQVCCGGSESLFSIWRVADGSLISVEQGMGAFDISPDGEALAIRGGDDIVEIRRTVDDSLLTSLGGFGAPISNLAFTSDGKQIITATNMHPGLMRLYDIDAGPFGIPQIADKEIYQPILDSASQSHYVSKVVIAGYGIPTIDSPDGRFSARRNRKQFDVFDKLNGELWFSSPANQAIRFSFSPDGQVLAVGLVDTSVELWNVYGKEKLYTLPPRTEIFYDDLLGGLAFSPDGKLLAVGLEDGTLRLFGIPPESGLPATPSFASIFPTVTPSATPSPIRAIPSQTAWSAQQNSERSGLQATLPSQEELSTIPSLWDSEYRGSNLVRAGLPPVDLTRVPNGPTDLSEPGTRYFDMAIDTDQPLLLPWLWCAKTDQMADNLKHLKVEFVVDEEVLPDTNILQYSSANPPVGFECRNWVTKISWGVKNNYSFSIRYTLDETIFDGVSSYPAGVYELKFRVDTLYKKRFVSEKYGFSFTFPPDIDTRKYYPGGNEFIASLSLDQRDIPNTDIVITSYISVWVEPQTDSCHLKPIGSDETRDKPEQVMIGNTSFTKIYGTLDGVLQNVEYMTYDSNICIHLYASFIFCSFDHGCVAGNGFPYMQGDLDRIISSFEWIEP
jgi:WD40 repeat protein